MNEKLIPESLDAMQVFLSDVSAKGILIVDTVKPVLCDFPRESNIMIA